MATKLTGLSADTTISSDDLLYKVDDPGGSPLSRKITFGDVETQLTNDGFLSNISGQDLSTADNTTSAFITLGDIPTQVTGADGDIQLNISGAFGTLAGTHLDTTGDARGTDSLDMQSLRGASTQVASGFRALTYGINNTASGDYAQAFGYGNTAGTGGLTSGAGNTATGGVAYGSGNSATTNGTSFGIANSASGTYFSVALGVSNTSLENAIAIGSGNNTTNSATAYFIGQNNSSTFGAGVVAIGDSNITNADGARIIGSSITNNTSNSVEIGSGDSTKFSVLSSGDVAFNNYTTTVSAALGSNGDVLTSNGTTGWSMQAPSGGTPLSLQVNTTPNGDQTLLNLSAGTNITLTDGGTGTVTIDATGGSLDLETDSTPNGDQTLLNLAAGTNINLTDNGTGTVTIDAEGFTWQEATADGTMTVNNGYTTNKGSLLTYTLPATAAVGSVIEIAGNSASGWLIAQSSGQTIHFGAFDTTTGATGSLASTARYDSVKLVCVTADTDFVVLSSTGNLAII